MIEFKSISNYNINIRHTCNGGCIVNIGCCEACFSNPADMLKALEEYYFNPEDIEKRYNSFTKNNPVRVDEQSNVPPDIRRTSSPDPDNNKYIC